MPLLALIHEYMKNSFYKLTVLLLTFTGCNVDENIIHEKHSSISQIEWMTYGTTNSGLHDDFIVCVEIDQEGNKWIGTFSKGIAKFDGTNWTVFNSKNSGLSNDSITDMTFDKENNLWVGTKNGISMFDNSNWEIFNTQNSDLPINLITAITIDQQDNIWIGCGHSSAGGLMKFDGSKWTLFTPENSILPCRIINDIFVDRENNIWIATFQYFDKGGIVKISEEIWTLYDKDNSPMPYNFADDIIQDLDGDIWVSTSAIIYSEEGVFHGVLLKYDGNNWHAYYPHDSNPKLTNRIFCIKNDNYNNIWITTIPEEGSTIEDYELAMFNGQEWFITSDYDSTILSSLVVDMEFDLQNRLWIGNAGYGLTKMEVDLSEY